MGYWIEDGEVIEDLTDWTDDDPRWDDDPHRHGDLSEDMAAAGDLHRKAVREGGA